MKLSKLVKQLTLLQEIHGDLEAHVYVDSGIEPITNPRIHVLQDFDFGSLGSRKTGDQVALIWSRS